MRFGLRPIIKPEYGFDHPIQLLWQLDGPRTAAIGDPRIRPKLVHLNRKRLAELFHRAR